MCPYTGVAAIYTSDPFYTPGCRIGAPNLAANPHEGTLESNEMSMIRDHDVTL